MADELRLKFFGNMEVRQDRMSVNGFRSSKAQALLCYLAVTKQPHNRSFLAGLLWGDLPEASARDNLSKTLTNLRRLMGAHLEISRQTIAFNRDAPYQLDVETFTSLLSRGSEKLSVEQLSEAVELYRGEFLEGFYVRDALAFEEWVVTQRARYRELALQGLHLLAAHYVKQGDYPNGIDYATRLLALEPWREEAHRQMMQLLALSGQRGAALAQYESCRQLLAEELEVEPGPETKALYQQIRDGKVGPRQAEEKVETEVGSLSTARASPPPFLAETPPQAETTSPFVARDSELNQLTHFLNLALNHQGRVAFIVGGAGRGKTVLADEFVRQAQQEHAELIVVQGRCSDYGGIGDPYLPFREVLSLLTGDIEAKWAAGAIDAEQAKRLWAVAPQTIQSLVTVSPDLVDIFVPGPALKARVAAVDSDLLEDVNALIAPKSSEQAPATLTQNALFAQYTKLLQTLARQQPLLLLLDDLQWADTGSISLLFHLGQRLAGQSMLIVGIYRPNDIAAGRNGERHPLEQVVNEFQRRYGSIHIDLTESADRQFVDNLIDSEPNRLGEPFREALFRQTEGHALFTVEMLHGLQERGDLVKDEQGRWIEGPALNWEILPARVEGAIKERIERLPAALQETLRTASVEGETFTAEVAAQVTGVPEREVIQQLHALDTAHRLVQNQGSRRLDPSGQRLSTYRFRHILFQKYLYGSLNETERTYLHETISRSLESLFGEQSDQIALKLAHHFRGANMLPQASRYMELAGKQALRSYANHEAIIFLKDALALLERLPETPERIQQKLRLLLTLIPPLILTKGYAAAEVGQISDQARSLCKPDEATPELFYALRGLWVYHFVKAELRRGHQLSRQLLTLARDLPDPAFTLEAHYALAGTLAILGDFAESCEHFEQAIKLYEPQQHRRQVLFFGPDLGVFCYSWIAHPLCHLGYLDQARKSSRKALRLAEELDHPFSLALALSYAAMSHQFCQDVPATRALAERAIAVCTEHDFVYYLAWCKILHGWAVAQQTPDEQAIDQMQRGLNDLLGTGAGIREPYYLGLLAEVYGRSGQPETGLALLDEAQTKASETKDCWYQAELHRLRGELLHQQQADEGKAAACYQRAIEVAQQQQGKLLELRAAVSLARLWQKQGRQEAAHDLLAGTYGWFSEGFDTVDLRAAERVLKAVEA